jgi:hypothetical protein
VLVPSVDVDAIVALGLYAPGSYGPAAIPGIGGCGRGAVAAAGAALLVGVVAGVAGAAVSLSASELPAG